MTDTTVAQEPSVFRPIDQPAYDGSTPVPPAPGYEPEPAAPAFNEPALRARELEVQRREDELDQRAARRHEMHVTPLTDKEVESQIVSEYAVCAWDAYSNLPNIAPDAERALRCITMVVLVLRNGFPIVGTSVCQAPENYDANEGRKQAREDALNRLWLLEEYAQRNRLMGMVYEPLDISDTDTRRDGILMSETAPSTVPAERSDFAVT
jgi:hypothetical protein